MTAHLSMILESKTGTLYRMTFEPAGQIRVQDAMNVEGPGRLFSAEEWEDIVTQVLNGELAL